MPYIFKLNLLKQVLEFELNKNKLFSQVKFLLEDNVN